MSGDMGFGCRVGMYPSGSKDPNSRVLEPKYYNICSIWALKPCYLGHCTLRVSELEPNLIRSTPTEKERKIKTFFRLKLVHRSSVQFRY